MFNTRFSDKQPSHAGAVAVLNEDLDLLRYFFAVLREKQGGISKKLNAKGEEDSDLGDLLFRHLCSIGRLLVQHCLFDKEADQRILSASCECLLQNVEVVGQHFERKHDLYFSQLSKIQVPSALRARFQFVDFPAAGKVGCVDSIDDLVSATLGKIAQLQDTIGDKIGIQSQLGHSQHPDVVAIGHLIKLVGVLVKLAKQNDQDGLRSLAVAEKVGQWAKKFGESRSFSAEGEDGQILKSFLDLLFTVNRMVKPTQSLGTEVARDIHSKLGDLNETIPVSRC